MNMAMGCTCRCVLAINPGVPRMVLMMRCADCCTAVGSADKVILFEGSDNLVNLNLSL